MSILNVEHLSHGFGDRAIFQDVSFRLLKGEHIGLIGANGEGKSTFMNIITGHMQPDEGKVEWSKRVRVGYLDQHTVKDIGIKENIHQLTFNRSISIRCFAFKCLLYRIKYPPKSTKRNAVKK